MPIKNTMNQELYFSASVEYWEPIYDYYCNNTGDYKKCITGNVFVLDHYPSKNEIIKIILGNNHKYIDCEVISYSELSKVQYDAYNET